MQRVFAPLLVVMSALYKRWQALVVHSIP